MSELTEAILTDVDSSRLIARVDLSGYKSYSSAPTLYGNQQRVLWSFAVTNEGRGAVEHLWSRQKQALLRTVGGQESLVRVIAFPVDRGSFGLLELL